MRLLCDEDIGTGVPAALYAVGYDAFSMRHASLPRLDPEWLPIAGRNRWLVLSANKRMLWNTGEVEAIRKNNVGIVFLTSGEEHPARVLMALIRRWSDLERLDANETRPFVRFLPPRGRLLTDWPGFPFT